MAHTRMAIERQDLVEAIKRNREEIEAIGIEIEERGVHDDMIQEIATILWKDLIGTSFNDPTRPLPKYHHR